MNKWIKIGGVTLLVLFFLGLAALLFIQRAAPEYLLDRITEKVQAQTKGRYQVSIDTLELELWPLSLRVSNFRFDRDTLADTLSGIYVLDAYDIRAELQELQLRDVGMLKLLSGGDINLDRLQLTRPALRIRKNKNFTAAEEPVDTLEVDTPELRTFSDSASRHIPVIEIGALRVEDGYFDFFDGENERPEAMIRGLSAGVTDFHSRRLYPVLSAAPFIEVDTASALISKGIARMTLTGLALTDTLLHLDSIYYGHIVNPYQVNRIKGFRTGWLDFQGRNLEIRGIDYQQGVVDSALAIQHINLEQFNFIFFKDKSETRLNPAYKALPSEMIRNIPIPIQIDTLQLQQGYMDIQMQAEAGRAPGRLVISGIHARILNLTNKPELLAQNPYLDLHVAALMMNRGPVDLHGRFKIDASDDQYEMKATVGAMPLTSLNHFIGSQFFIQFASGQLQSMQLEYTGDKRIAQGKLDLEYADLKLQKLANFQKFRETQPKNGFLVSMGNVVVPRHRNRDKKRYKTGIIFYEKPANRDVVHVLVESMLSGVVSSMGFGPKSMKKADKKAAKARQKKQKVDE